MRRSHLPPYEFRAETWDAISERAAEIAALDQNLRYVEDLVKSIRDSGVEHELAGSFSMMDLRVAAVPVTTPPVEYIGVYGPTSTPSTGNGKVRLVHRTASGRDDSIERPSAEVVPVFWRFVREKYGIGVGAS